MKPPYECDSLRKRLGDAPEDQERGDDVASVPETTVENVTDDPSTRVLWLIFNGLSRALTDDRWMAFNERRRVAQAIYDHLCSAGVELRTDPDHAAEYALILDVVAKARAVRAAAENWPGRWPSSMTELAAAVDALPPAGGQDRAKLNVGPTGSEDLEARLRAAEDGDPRSILGIAPEAIRRWRVGSHVGRTIYIQSGDEASKSDVLIGVMDTPELAQIVVDAVNARGAS